MLPLESYRGFLYFEAILFVLLGCLGIALPQFFTIGLELLIGILFLVAGIVQAIRLAQSWEKPGRLSSILSIILNLGLGALLLFFPLAGVFSITYLLIAYFLIEGFAKIFYSVQLQSWSKWGWIFLSGLLSLGLALLIFTGLPGTATWVLGLLVGINMLFFGIVLLSFAMNLPKKSA